MNCAFSTAPIWSSTAAPNRGVGAAFAAVETHPSAESATNVSNIFFISSLLIGPLSIIKARGAG
jgi:hypothetical protein